MRLDANKDYGAPGAMIWVERVAPEAEPTVPEGEIDAADAPSIKLAERSVGKDYEPEDFF